MSRIASEGAVSITARIDADLELLVDDIAAWMGLPARAAAQKALPKGVFYLPPAPSGSSAGPAQGT